jgi:hypothetical protein
MHRLKIHLGGPKEGVIADVPLEDLIALKGGDLLALLDGEIDFPGRCAETGGGGCEEGADEVFDGLRGSWFERDFEGVDPVHDYFLGCATGTGPEGGVSKKTFKEDNPERPPATRG